MTTQANFYSWPERLALLVVVLTGVAGVGMWAYLLW